MIILIALISLFIFIKTVSYGIFELKENKNKLGAIFIFLLATFVLIIPTVISLWQK